MNHLTNIYKHKCEQLQEQLNHLTKILNEVSGGGGLNRYIGGEGAERAAREAAERAAREAAERAAREAAERAARTAAEIAAHAALLRTTMGQLMTDLKMLPFGSWLQFWEVFTPIEREAFIALFGSQTPVVLEGMVAGVPAQFIRYRTPNGEWAVMYNHAMPLPGGGSHGHPNWIPLTKGNTPFGQINSQGFLVLPTEVLNNTPGDIFVRPNPTSTTPSRGSGGGSIGGGGLGSQTGNPM